MQSRNADRGLAPARGGKAPSSSSNVSSAKKLLELVPMNIDPDKARQLQLRSKAIATLPAQLGAVFREVRKLDLAHNNITDVKPLATLVHLSNLNLSHNPVLKSLEGLNCKKLVVLSVSSCGLSSLKGIEESAATLCTLVANDNDLTLQSPTSEAFSGPIGMPSNSAATAVAIENYRILSLLQLCETVVLSRNPRLCERFAVPSSSVEGESGDGEEASTEKKRALADAHPLSVFSKLPALKKLSLSECGLTSLPARWFLPLVTELRLVHNALSSLQPEGVIVRSLRILDVSHNELATVASLRRCIFVRQINLRANPLVETYAKRDLEEGIAESVVPVTLQRSLSRMMRDLESVDGHPLASAETLRKRHNTRGDAAGENGDKTLRESGEVSEEEGVSAGKSESRNAGKEKEAKLVEPKTKKVKVDPAVIAAEADALDVVVEAPQLIANASQAPIVRRERVVPVPKKAGVTVSGAAAVTQLLSQKKQAESSAW